MSHDLSGEELRAAAALKDDPERQYRIVANVTVVVHDLDKLRAAARRALDHGRFEDEQARRELWASVENDPARLVSQAIDIGRLTEDIPGVLGHDANWTVCKVADQG
jgi:hypothetical protein